MSGLGATWTRNAAGFRERNALRRRSSSSVGASTLKRVEVEALYGALPYSLPGSVLAVVGLSQWTDALSARGRAGVLIIVAAQLFSLAVWIAYRAMGGWRGAPGPWQALHFAVTGVHALAWGGLALQTVPHLPAPEALNVVLAVVAVACAGVGVQLTSPPAAGLWLGLSILPLAVGLLQAQGPHASDMAAAVALCGAGLLGVALHQRRRQLRGLVSRAERGSLIEALRRQKHLAEQANRDKSRFLAAASHDLRQPMHALGLFAHALEQSPLDGAQRRVVQNLNRCIEALDRSFNALLDVSKIDAGVVTPELQAFELRDVFRRLHMQHAGRAEERGLQLRFAPGGRVAVSDPALLERLLGNLVHNAIKYTRHGGVMVVARGQGERMRIEVWDTGAGIASADLPHVFDEFYQCTRQGRDRAEGLGMGLAIVQRLSALLDHPVEVRSRVGRGTMFRVSVPQRLAGPTQADWDETDTVPPVQGKAGTLLLIDDEEAIREACRLLLGCVGYTVLTAATVANAVRLARERSGEIDAVVSDLRLSHGEDGLEAVEAVYEALGRRVPALLVTGDTVVDEVRRVHACGHKVLFKPVQPRDLLEAVRTLA